MLLSMLTKLNQDRNRCTGSGKRFVPPNILMLSLPAWCPQEKRMRSAQTRGAALFSFTSDSLHTVCSSEHRWWFLWWWFNGTFFVTNPRCICVAARIGLSQCVKITPLLHWSKETKRMKEVKRRKREASDLWAGSIAVVVLSLAETLDVLHHSSY